LTFSDGKMAYEMEILKKDAAGDECFRRTFSYEGEKGVGRLIHTYETNGDPLPSFTGTPRRVAIPDDIDEFAEDIWNALDSGNRIALYVLYRNIATNEERSVLINRHTKAEE
ncbi:MAG: inosine monophosphate cyclohydrolase, partial [Lachnospiraceae bacterium]|nr:inosine monophosphate cyclohydrolase [Lachnospiraceae bacterium]